jgi:hypothetical protein
LRDRKRESLTREADMAARDPLVSAKALAIGIGARRREGAQHHEVVPLGLDPPLDHLAQGEVEIGRRRAARDRAHAFSSVVAGVNSITEARLHFLQTKTSFVAGFATIATSWPAMQRPHCHFRRGANCEP